MNTAIRIKNLGKRYRISHSSLQNSYRTLRESLVDLASGPMRRIRGHDSKGTIEDFWALQNVSVEIQEGEVVGIIGRNGAGKSTFLKILSRIAKPTVGRVEIAGSVGSLLEVGTGFHPELTGRENIYLYGAILGMSRKDIGRKFDDMVCFSEVQNFLDTPVKRYSSGMYVRLAFSVAAHMEPEILLVDEVLSVGDVSFQQKCLQKMEGLKKEGRTILFVSHNMSLIRLMCKKVMILESGRLVGCGDTVPCVTEYLSGLAVDGVRNLDSRTDREGDGRVRLVDLRFEQSDGTPTGHLACGDSVKILMHYVTQNPTCEVKVALSCWTTDGVKIFHVDNLQTRKPLFLEDRRGVFVCEFPKFSLPSGRYYLNVLVSMNGRICDHVTAAAKMDVEAGDFYRSGATTNEGGGLVLMDHNWV
jgi:lipopolysaccharide transport system ATP-binding protein